jgi:hypothetical protein
MLSRNYGRARTATCDAFECVGKTRRKIAEFTSPFNETAIEQKTLGLGPISTGMPAKSDKLDDVLKGWY